VIRAQDAAAPLLDELLAGQPVDRVLLEALGRSAAANIADYPRRVHVGPLLSDDTRRLMLAAPGDFVARGMQPADPLPEPPLTEAILEPALLGALAHDDAPQAVRLVTWLPVAGPQHAVLIANRGRFDRVTAEAFGQLVVERRWKRVAERIVDLPGVVRT